MNKVFENNENSTSKVKRRLILRADGNSIIGYGHIYRLLALADILKDKFEITFVTTRLHESLACLVKSYVDKLIEIQSDFEYVLPALKEPGEEIPFDLNEQISGAEIIVLDGYWFGSHYQKAVKSMGVKLVSIDDFGSDYFYADLVINQAPGIERTLYKGEYYTNYYLGLDYALLRSDFYRPLTVSPRNNSLLISMGGVDSYGLTDNILGAAIYSNSFNQIHLLTSSGYSTSLLARIAERTRNASIDIMTHQNLSGLALVEIMDTCSFALTSASTILIECYSRGISCMTGYYTDNQLNMYNGFVKENRAIGLGNLRISDSSRLSVEIVKAKNFLEKPEKLIEPLRSNKNLENIFTQL